MATSFVDEYLVKLGASVDQSGMQNFFNALKAASIATELSAATIAGALFKAQTEIVGGFLAIGGAVVGTIDKVAMADQSYRLLALNMHISKQAARELQVSMDALDASLGQMTWDPELRKRAQQLIGDQRAMAPDGDFDAQMRKIRDIRFEFTRMEVEGQYLAMNVVSTFMQSLGLGPDALLEKLQRFNDWVTHNLPVISATIVKEFMPVWMDVKDVALTTGVALEAVGTAFTNVVGLLSGDHSIEGSTFSLKKFGDALVHIANGFAELAKFVAYLEESVAHLISALSLLFSGKFAAADVELDKGVYAMGKALFSDLKPTTTSTADGAGAAGNTDVHALIDKQAAALGVDPVLLHSLAHVESGEQQFDKNGKVITANANDPRSHAMGVFQLEPATERALGVDASTVEGNVKGGTTLFAHLLHEYRDKSDPEAYAVAAFHEGESAFNKFLAGRGQIRQSALDETRDVLRGKGRTGDVHIEGITIHITAPNARAAGDAVVSRLHNLRIQRNLAEAQDTGASG